jgi:acetyl-CoA C-acetyltransferase
MGTRSLYAAVNMAYSQAGIRDPRKEIDVAEVHDSTPYHELMAYEALGFCRPGEAWRLAMEGCVSFGSDLPVNPSGGVLCSNPQFCAGLVRIAEAALQVMNAAGDHQVPGVLTAVAQAGCGIPGQNNTVVVLSAEPPKA